MLKISQRITYMQAFKRSSLNTPDKKNRMKMEVLMMMVRMILTVLILKYQVKKL